MNMKYSLCALCVLTVAMTMCISTSASVNPGIKVRLSQKGIQYAANEATKVLTRDVSTMTIPDQSGSSGKFKYEVSTIRLTSFTPPATTVTTTPFTWSLVGTSASIHGDWHYWTGGWIHVSDHGSFDISLTVDISATITIGMDARGKPTIHAVSCTSDVTHADVHLHGGASWLYNLFDHTIEKIISDNLNDKLCDCVNNVINVKAAQNLATLPMEVELADTVVLDYHLVAPPTFTSAYIDASFKGEFFWIGDKQECPLKPEPIPAASVPSQMVSFWLTEYSINSLGYVEYKHGALQYDLDKTDLPPNTQGILDTTCASFFVPCIGGLIPIINKQYPNTSMTLDIQVSEPPVMRVTPAGITGTWKGIVDFNVLVKPNQPKFLFSCDALVTFNVTTGIKDQNITAAVNNFTSHLTLKNSTIGKIDVDNINTVLKGVITGFVIPKLNMLGKQGFMLPMIKDVAYDNPRLVMMKSALFVTVDLRYIGV